MTDLPKPAPARLDDDGPTAAAGHDLPDEAWVVALAGLYQMGPGRLRALLDGCHPVAAWNRVEAGTVLADASARLRRALGPRPDRVVSRWRQQAAATDIADIWQRHVDAGVGVHLRSSPAYPTPFLDDPEPPSVVFSAGDPDVVQGPRVSIVGTRDCTRYGYDVAHRLGAELSAAGVSVVSGLALGIDGAAHAGALDAAAAPPVAVVGSGLDRPYPARHARLWERVAAAGVVLTEYPLGTPPLAWHFPTRNRLIAALADVVVVVESQEVGGSMITVEAAIDRGVDVLAVPGPITSATSAGTNRLLFEGRGTVRDTMDVLVALGMSAGARRCPTETRTPPQGPDGVVLDALGWQPATFDQLVLRTGLVPLELTVALDRLVEGGWVDARHGWYQRISRAGRAEGGR